MKSNNFIAKNEINGKGKGWLLVDCDPQAIQHLKVFLVQVYLKENLQLIYVDSIYQSLKAAEDRSDDLNSNILKPEFCSLVFCEEVI